MTKICANCKRELDEKFFGKNKRNKDGLHSYCKECNAKKAYEYNKGKGRDKYIRAVRKQNESGYFRFGHGAFVNMKKSADKRNISFELTEEELKEWWHKCDDVCHYCGITEKEYVELSKKIEEYCGNNETVIYIKQHVFNKDSFYRIKTMTVDRVDSNGPYAKNNIVKSCWICNSLKSNKYSEQEMISAAREIREILKGDGLL